MCVNNVPKVTLDSTAAGIEPAISIRKSNTPNHYATEPHVIPLHFINEWFQSADSFVVEQFVQGNLVSQFSEADAVDRKRRKTLNVRRNTDHMLAGTNAITIRWRESTRLGDAPLSEQLSNLFLCAAGNPQKIITI